MGEFDISNIRLFTLEKDETMCLKSEVEWAPVTETFV